MLQQRWLPIAVVSLVLAACAPAAPPSPTAAPAKPAEAAKPTESQPAAPAAQELAPAKPADKPASNYYAGKTITLVAGSSAGGGTDTIVRLVQRHLPRFIPGKPNIIVQNEEGAGGVIALNNVANAKPDGLTYNGSVSQALLFGQLQGISQAKFDLKTLTWIGSAFDDSNILWLRTATPYTDLDAIRQASTPPKLGAQSGTHPSVVIPRIVQEVTGLKFNVIVGYPGSPEIFLDVERGALDGRFASYGSLLTQRPEWVENKTIRFLLFTGKERHKELPDVPTVADVIPADRRSLLPLIYAPQLMNRAMAGPPGIPPDIAKLMQDAYGQMARDREFLSDMEKTCFDAGYLSPADIQDATVKLLDDEAMKTTLRSILSAK